MPARVIARNEAAGEPNVDPIKVKVTLEGRVPSGISALSVFVGGNERNA